MKAKQKRLETKPVNGHCYNWCESLQILAFVYSFMCMALLPATTSVGINVFFAWPYVIASVCVSEWINVCICRVYFYDQVGGGRILTYDAGKETLRLTGQTVLWLLGPLGSFRKGHVSTCWRDFHSYWTSHNIWDTSGTNSLMKRERQRERERSSKSWLLTIWSHFEQKKEEQILRPKIETYLTFSTQS